MNSAFNDAQTTNTPCPPPGPHFNHPLGALLPLRSNVLKYATQNCMKYGGVTSLRAAHIRVVFVSRPEACEYIVRQNHENFRKGKSFQQLRLIMGNGLLVADGPSWKQQRRMAQPHFNKPVVLGYRDQIAECTANLMKRLEQHAQSGEPIDLLAEMLLTSFQLVGKTMLGSEIEKEMSIVEEYLPDVGDFLIKQINAPIPLPLWVPLPSHRKFIKARNVLDQLVHRIIDRRRQEGAEGNDLLSKLMTAVDPETGESLTSQQLRDEVMSTLLAGHETTADGLAWTWYHLMLNQEVTQKLHAEVDTQLSGHMATSDDLSKLPYVGQVIDESLRIIPPAWSFTREAVAPDQVCGYEVRPQDMIVVSPYILHRWPDLYPNPECFDPERFAPEIAKQRDRWHYLPFGAGPHNCIGQHFALIEMKTVVAAMAQRFNFELAPGANVVMDAGITIRPKYGLPVLVRERFK